MRRETAIGIAIEIIGNGGGIGLQIAGYVNPPLGWGIIGVSSVVGIIFIVYGIRKKEWAKEGQSSGLYDIIPILHKMDRHLWHLADSQNIVNIDIEKFNKTAAKINQIMKIKAATPTFSDSTGKLINDAKNILEKQEKQITAMVKRQEYEKNYQILTNTTKLLDSDGYGLKYEKANDKRYLKYSRMVDEYFDKFKDLITSDLTYLINLHIAVSEHFANGLLVLKRVDLITKKTGISILKDLAPPTTQANLENLSVSSNNQLNDIRVMIAECIRGLEKLK